MFGPVLPALAANHQVITPDLQGHGRTADIDRPLDVRLMADDIAALIRHLGLEQARRRGLLAGRRRGVLDARRSTRSSSRRLVVVSAHITRDAIYPEMLRAAGAGRARRRVECLKDTPMYQGYERWRRGPRTSPRLLDKIGACMAEDFDFSEEVRGLQVPTLIVAADADMAPPSHYVEVFKLLDGGLRDGGWMGEGRPKGGHALAILPGLTHYNLGMSPLFATVTLAFLDAPGQDTDSPHARGPKGFDETPAQRTSDRVRTRDKWNLAPAEETCKSANQAASRHHHWITLERTGHCWFDERPRGLRRRRRDV